MQIIATLSEVVGGHILSPPPFFPKLVSNFIEENLGKVRGTLKNDYKAFSACGMNYFERQSYIHPKCTMFRFSARKIGKFGGAFKKAPMIFVSFWNEWNVLRYCRVQLSISLQFWL